MGRLKTKNMKMLKNSFVVLFLLLFVSCGNNSKQPELEAGKKVMQDILKSIKAPVFPNKNFLITDFGAKPDGPLCTNAFRLAIEACNKAGGGRVIVPNGVYYTGAIHLLSNVNLHLEDSAVIRFSTNPNDYLPVVRTRYEGNELYNYSPLIYAYKQKNIAITGKGTFDGQASIKNWWAWILVSEEDAEKEDFPYERGPKSRGRLYRMMTNDVPVENRIFGSGYYIRPSFIQPFECKNVLIEGVTVKNPPMWMIHPILSENITVRNVTLYSKGAPNGDGCDPECCKNVLIDDCIFQTGDDCVAIKSGRNRDGYNLGIPSENIIIRNCKMQGGHGGFVLGSELSGGIRNVFAYNCVITSPNLQRALRIKSNKFRGGFVENVFVWDIKVDQVAISAICINQNYTVQLVGAQVRTTKMKNIYIDNMTCNKAKYALSFTGLSDTPIENVKVTNSQFNNIEQENIIKNVVNLNLVNVRVNGKSVELPQ